MLRAAVHQKMLIEFLTDLREAVKPRADGAKCLMTAARVASLTT